MVIRCSNFQVTTKMAIIVTPLTFARIKAAKPKEKLYKLSDGAGLSLWVYPSGRMVWAFKYREDGKQKTEYLGEYPIFSLLQAREWREKLRARMANGLPVVDIKPNNEQFLFTSVYQAWFERWAPQKKAVRYTVQVKAAIDRNVLPILGHRDVRTIKPFDVVQSLRAMEERGALEYLKRVKSSLKLLFGYAVSSGLIDFNPVTSIDSQAFKKAEKGHFAALTPAQLPDLVAALDLANTDNTTRLAIFWQLLTMTRPIETVSARWADIDLEARSWTIPAEVMKKSRPHVVPLCSALVALLPRIRNINVSGEFLFEGMDYTSHLDREAPRMALRRAGLPTTAHGLRALAGTILEEAGYPEPVIHAALSHSKGKGDLTAAAYMRSTFYEERQKMMEYLGAEVMKCINL